MHEYLPSDTLQWCHDTLRQAGFNLPIDGGEINPEGTKIHVIAYQFLCDTAANHISSGMEPMLSESVKPLASNYGSDWQPSERTRRAFAAAGEAIVEDDLLDEGDMD